MPSADRSAQEAVDAAKRSVAAREDWWQRMCLKWVRTQWGVPARYATAQDAWRNSKDRHTYNGDPFSIPYGAPVFSLRPGGGPSDAGHVFMACGVYRDRRGVKHRVFRGTDMKVPGEPANFELSAITEKWGHRILGYTGDLNGVDLNLENKVRA